MTSPNSTIRRYTPNVTILLRDVPLSVSESKLRERLGLFCGIPTRIFFISYDEYHRVTLVGCDSHEEADTLIAAVNGQMLFSCSTVPIEACKFSDALRAAFSYETPSPKSRSLNCFCQGTPPQQAVPVVSPADIQMPQLSSFFSGELSTPAYPRSSTEPNMYMNSSNINQSRNHEIECENSRCVNLFPPQPKDWRILQGYEPDVVDSSWPAFPQYMQELNTNPSPPHQATHQSANPTPHPSNLCSKYMNMDSLDHNYIKDNLWNGFSSQHTTQMPTPNLSQVDQNVELEKLLRQATLQVGNNIDKTGHRKSLSASNLFNRKRANGLDETSDEKASMSIYGPPGANLFIFHIPSKWEDSDLLEHFISYGFILSARIRRDSTGRNVGYGFVSFSNQQSAWEAIKGMNGFHASDKWLKVTLKKGEEGYLPGFNQGEAVHNVMQNYQQVPGGSITAPPVHPYNATTYFSKANSYSGMPVYSDKWNMSSLPQGGLSENQFYNRITQHCESLAAQSTEAGTDVCSSSSGSPSNNKTDEVVDNSFDRDVAMSVLRSILHASCIQP